MLALAPIAPTSLIMGQPPEYGLGQLGATESPPQFKKHKILPRPPHEPRADENYLANKPLQNVDHFDPRILGSIHAHTYKLHSPSMSEIGDSGPDPPPTPPTHSRTSSTNYPSNVASNPSNDRRQQTSQRGPLQPPITPPDKRSPPTPDVTPPQGQTSIRVLQPPLWNRTASGTTPCDSRTESFTTAREEQVSSEDDGSKGSGRTARASAQTSQTTVIRIDESGTSHHVPPKVLDQALEQLSVAPEEVYTPGTTKEFAKFDGQWASANSLQVDQKLEHTQDDGQRRVGRSRKQRQISRASRISTRPEVIEDNTVTSTAATRAARYVHTIDTVDLDSSPVTSSRPSISETSSGADVRKSSGTSAQSSASPIVEVILLDRRPQKERTLRHVKKLRTLRSVGSSNESDALNQVKASGNRRQSGDLHITPKTSQDSPKREVVSRTLQSGKARREIWNSGAVPVVIVPDRRSSHRAQPSKEPSLRSTSSRRSKRTMSLGSSVTENLFAKDPSTAMGEPRSRHERTFSESAIGSERTIDFPPSIPPRSSSLSAPTSRNASRRGSVTADGVFGHGKLDSPPMFNGMPRDSEAQKSEAMAHPMIKAEPQTQSESSHGEGHDALGVECPDDNLSTKKFSSRNTPFSAASIDTNWTAPEVSEALAVHMYQHQNSSLLVVDNSGRPSEASEDVGEALGEETVLLQAPKIVRTSPEGGPPVTPPDQQHVAAEDVDSPLRNPRAPPDPPTIPPAIALIPATPSGLTPSNEQTKNLGNYFEVTAERPPRRPSIVKRAFSRRRHSIDYTPPASTGPGLLTRTFSLSRYVGKSLTVAPWVKAKRDLEWYPAYSRDEFEPTESDKLHPFWRPQDSYSDCEFGEDCPHHRRSTTEVSRTRRPPGSRSLSVKRSLSDRMRQTFAILPVRPEDRYPSDFVAESERRTIRRTGSGNLRVVRHQTSADSLHRTRKPRVPQFPPISSFGRPLGRSYSLQADDSAQIQRRFSLSRTLDEFPYLPRALSERRREKRTQELRQMISGPKEVRDGVGEVIRSQDRRTRSNTETSYPERI